MDVWDSPWWWSPDRADGATTVCPIQSPSAETASDRAIPSVCAVLRLKEPAFTWRRTPLAQHRCVGGAPALLRRIPHPAPGQVVVHDAHRLEERVHRRR